MNERLIKRNLDVLETEVDGEVALMSVENGKYYSLNPTASSIWQNLASELTFQDLNDRLLRQYNVEPGMLSVELEEILSKFETEGLITFK